MTGKKTFYDILGVPNTATTDQIKRRYRQLVRKYHPDVAEDKAAAKAAFIEIAEAYQTLINQDKRVIYDSSLWSQTLGARGNRPGSSPSYKPPSASGTRPQSRPTSTQSRPRPQAQSNTQQRSQGNRVGEANRFVAEAQTAFNRGQFRNAILASKEAQRLDPKNIQAHVILGDIYRIQGHVEEAISMYSVVVQLDPRNADVQAKLNRLTRQKTSARASTTTDERYTSLKLGINMIGWSMLAILLVYLSMNPGVPIEWLRNNIPIVDTWSAELVAVLMIGSFIVGLLLSLNELVHPLDEELVFKSVRSPAPKAANYPLLLILVVFNLFSFYLASAVYILVGLVQECLSKTVLRALIFTFAIVLIAALIYPEGRAQVFWFGGNIALPSLLFGWMIGDMFRPGW